MTRLHRTSPTPAHPKGIRARILLSSVYGPFAVDNEESREATPMEFCHGQATRFQKAFSIRQFTRTYNLFLLQCNLEAPCTVLDFPTQARFIQELRENDYDIVGIGSIGSNSKKVRTMCQLIRRYKPEATIIVGGHIANTDHFLTEIDADIVVPGEGIRWLQEYLGQDTTAPIRHPITLANFDTRVMGVRIPGRFTTGCAPVFPGVGCPEGCDFCLTSAKFGGKGKSISFYKTGDELFSILDQIERKIGVRSFTILDENFLLYRKRALRLLELMQQHGKSWDIYTFSSAKVIETYTMEQLVGLGLTLVWVSIEGKNSHFKKLDGIDTLTVAKKYQSHGIRIVGSAIVGLPEHTLENIDAAIDYSVEHNADLMQFMLYMPAPGTQLFERMTKSGKMIPLEQMPVEDWHGQFKFNYQHPHIPAGAETELMERAFKRDFEMNGPSLLRMFDTQLTGYLRYKNDPDPRIRARFARHTNAPWSVMASALTWAARKHFAKEGNARVVQRLDAFLGRLQAEFPLTRASTPVLGRVFSQLHQREEAKLAAGHQLDPGCSVFKNRAALALEGKPAELEVPWAVCGRGKPNPPRVETPEVAAEVAAAELALEQQQDPRRSA
ncbi:MAG: Radical domain protein [Myxococcaceae bacterium]|nr:Radical domain protein [Myxococcaceae bacterium]